MTELSEEMTEGDVQEPSVTVEAEAGGEPAGPWYEGAALGDGEARWLGSKGYGSLGELVQAYRALERYQGKSVALPASGASEEDWRRLYGRLGCPAAPDGYRFDGVAANGPDDEAGLAWYRETAHRLGLSQRQAGELLSAFVVRNDQLEGAMREHAEAGARAALDELLAEWGPAAERNFELARRAALALDLGDDDVAVLGRGAGSDAGLLRLLARLAPCLGEDAGIGRGRDRLSASREQARSRISSIYADQEHPYHDGEAPGHAAAVEEMLRLNELLHGEE